MDLSVYIHIPFCEKKCYYCDFSSFSGMEEYFETYTAALAQEIHSCSELDGANIITVFIGGGTPSVLPPKYVEKILLALNPFSIAKGAEITIEANPNSLTRDKLRDYNSFGINRLSVGLQAYQSHLLDTLGRLHRAEDFLCCIDSAFSAGFSNISADLIFAIPGQSLTDWEESLKAVIRAGLPHVSCYGLAIEENTPFYEKYKPVDEDLDRRMYYRAVELLNSCGYCPYEISNFAKDGFDSRHNSVYWERGNYLGFGLSAHSLYNNVRFENTGDLSEYMNSIDEKKRRKNIIKLTHKESMEEFMFLGLRMTKGVSAERFLREFGADLYEVYGGVIRKHVGNKLLDICEDKIRLTPKGVDLSNFVLSEFL